ncbi:MAG: hypothetical protein ABIH23_15595, partial [bacterium]
RGSFYPSYRDSTVVSTALKRKTVPGWQEEPGVPNPRTRVTVLPDHLEVFDIDAEQYHYGEFLKNYWQ